ncbi:Uncharacterised protein [Vibrio cholerae]|nr:Uncharacterised protein [Vibrio cholerae]
MHRYLANFFIHIDNVIIEDKAIFFRHLDDAVQHHARVYTIGIIG